MCFFPFFCTPVEQNRTDHIRHKKEMQNKIDHGSCLRYLPCFSQPQGSTDSVHGRRDHQKKISYRQHQDQKLCEHYKYRHYHHGSQQHSQYKYQYVKWNMYQLDQHVIKCQFLPFLLIKSPKCIDNVESVNGDRSYH